MYAVNFAWSGPADKLVVNGEFFRVTLGMIICANYEAENQPDFSHWEDPGVDLYCKRAVFTTSVAASAWRDIIQARLDEFLIQTTNTEPSIVEIRNYVSTNGITYLIEVISV
jgi:hypothetical protein